MFKKVLKNISWIDTLGNTDYREITIDIVTVLIVITVAIMLYTVTT